MVGFERFPHTLKFEIISDTSDSVQDENGDWIPKNSTSVLKEFECRAEPANQGATYRGENGERIQYDYLIFAGPGIYDLTEQQEVKFFDNDRLIGKGIAKKIDTASRLNTRIWV